MANVLGTGWLNTNSLRNYPLSQSATGVSSQTGFKLPDDLFVDMKLAVPYVFNTLATASAVFSFHPATFQILHIDVYPQGFVVTVGATNSTNFPFNITTVVAVSEPISFATFEPYSTVQLLGSTFTANSKAAYDFSGSYGVLTLGNISGLQGLGGRISFSLAEGRLEASVVSFGPRRISGFKVASAGNLSPLLHGQITLTSGPNHNIAVTGSATAGYVLNFNAIDGQGLADICPCSDVELGPCIRTINNVPPTTLGNITLVGSDCISVTSEESTSTIDIADTCAKPGCGCNELQVLVADVEALTTNLGLLQAQMAILASGTNSLQNTCLGSQIDSTSCAQDPN